MKKIVLPLLLLGVLVLTLQLTNSQNQPEIKSLNTLEDDTVLLELFTSQGCSSCPSADRLLDKTLQNNPNAIGLSYHVDYWNYIGWEDPFSTKEYSNYQRSYASKFRSSSIYTPQLVVNGKTHFTGSNTSKLNSALKTYAVSNDIDVSNINQSKSEVMFTVSAENKADLITAVLVISERTTKIPRGENRNRTLTNKNIVVDRTLISDTNSGNMTLKLPSFVLPSDQFKVIVFSQTDNLNVTAAKQLALN